MGAQVWHLFDERLETNAEDQDKPKRQHYTIFQDQLITF